MPDIAVPATFDVLVAQYVKLQDAIKAADDAHALKTKVARDHLVLLNGTLLDKLNNSGGESVKTASGTAYRTTRKSATIADGSVFREFVRENELWDIVDWKANATAVDEYLKTQGALPPGINYSETFTVGVRRT